MCRKIFFTSTLSCVFFQMMAKRFVETELKLFLKLPTSSLLHMEVHLGFDGKATAACCRCSCELEPVADFGGITTGA